MCTHTARGVEVLKMKSDEKYLMRPQYLNFSPMTYIEGGGNDFYQKHFDIKFKKKRKNCEKIRKNFN
jgi:hypothetical protein